MLLCCQRCCLFYQLCFLGFIIILWLSLFPQMELKTWSDIDYQRMIIEGFSWVGWPYFCLTLFILYGFLSPIKFYWLDVLYSNFCRWISKKAGKTVLIVDLFSSIPHYCGFCGHVWGHCCQKIYFVDESPVKESFFGFELKSPATICSWFFFLF